MKFHAPVAFVLGAALAVPSIATAHHSFAMFEPEKTVEMKGVVKEVQWANPHVWINIVATNPEGQPEDWGIEAGATNTLLRQGWKRDSLKPGDKIDVVMRPMRNGTHAGSLKKITTEDGTILTLGVQGARPEESDSK
jgi:hypothetical protein